MPPASPLTPRKPRVLFCVDIANWAHDFKSRNIIKYLSQDYHCRICYEEEVTRDDLQGADIIIVFYWMQFVALRGFMDILQRKIVLTGISCPTDLEEKRRVWGMPVLTAFNGVFVHNQILADEYRHQFPGQQFYLNPIGVDTRFFCPAETRPTGTPLVAGWAGSLKNHRNKRGYLDIIMPAIDMTPGVRLYTAAREDKWRGPEELLGFYRTLDVYLVASRVEGTPNPALEAAACGVPIIATAVGNMPELIRDGENGFLVERTAAAFSEKLALLRDDYDLLKNMRAYIRQDILAWDWSIRAQAYKKMIAESLISYGWKAD